MHDACYRRTQRKCCLISINKTMTLTERQHFMCMLRLSKVYRHMHDVYLQTGTHHKTSSQDNMMTIIIPQRITTQHTSRHNIHNIKQQSQCTHIVCFHATHPRYRYYHHRS